MSENHYGLETPTSSSDDYNTMSFLVAQMLGKLQTIALVRVVAVTNDGGIAPVGTVDVQPLVNQMSGNRTATPHGTIFGIPYFRIQGGADAIILDPKVGDIGMCGFASRDISAVKTDPAAAVANAAAGKGGANPGSFRQFNWADGLYFGGFLNGTPTRYVRFHAGGIDLKAATIHVEGDLTVSGAVVADGDVTGNGISLHDHVHSGVEPGGGTSGPPV